MLASLAAIDLGDLGERARRVDGRDRDPRRKALLVVLVDVPAHVDPALRLVVEGRQRRRLDRIDGDARARLHDADDAVAGHRALRRETHRQVAAHAADRQRVALAFRCSLPRLRDAAGHLEQHAGGVADVRTSPPRAACGAWVTRSSLIVRDRPPSARRSTTARRGRRRPARPRCPCAPAACSTGFRLSLARRSCRRARRRARGCARRAPNIACGWRSWWRGGWPRAPCR